MAPIAGFTAGQLLGEGVTVNVAAADKSPSRTARGVDILGGLSVRVPRSPQQISGKAVHPLVPLPGGGALVARIGDQPHYVIADPDLVNNQALHDRDSARAALALIDALNSTDATGVDFDLTMNGLGQAHARSLLRLALDPPFLSMTLALVAAALLAGLHGAFRFGPAQREARAIAFGKAALVENSAGLIRLAEREPHLGAAYADVVRHETARVDRRASRACRANRSTAISIASRGPASRASASSPPRSTPRATATA